MNDGSYQAVKKLPVKSHISWQVKNKEWRVDCDDKGSVSMVICAQPFHNFHQTFRQ